MQMSESDKMWKKSCDMLFVLYSLCLELQIWNDFVNE